LDFFLNHILITFDQPTIRSVSSIVIRVLFMSAVCAV